MDSLQKLEIIILLLIAVLALTTVARRLAISYPILLVVGGLALSFVPGLPIIHLDPDLVFFVFLPLLLWAAAYFTSWRDFRANARPITLLAVGLVLVTTLAVASVAHVLLPGLDWAEAIVLGAIVSPPDAVSATSVVKKLNLPRRNISILEGESLVNDATALVVYRSALAAAVSGYFNFNDALLEFIRITLLGVGIGFVIGMVCRWALSLTDDSFIEIAITLLAPYIAWVVAELAGASAVLACVIGGLYVRRYFSAIVTPITRIQARAIWDFLVFVLNGIIFILIGLHLGVQREAIPIEKLMPLTLIGMAITLTAIIVRLIWVPLATWLPRKLFSLLHAQEHIPSLPSIFIISWAGMRGIVSLAAALALPLTTETGAPFPFRAEIILITFMVILATLVGQGLSLPFLIRFLNLGKDRSIHDEEKHARKHAEKAALTFLDNVLNENWPAEEHVEQLRLHYKTRWQYLTYFEESDTSDKKMLADTLQRLRHEAMTVERLALIKLCNEGVISDEILHRLEQELDIEAIRFGIGEKRMSISKHR